MEGVSILCLISHVDKLPFWRHFNIISLFIQLHDFINKQYDYDDYYDEDIKITDAVKEDVKEDVEERNLIQTTPKVTILEHWEVSKKMM